MNHYQKMLSDEEFSFRLRQSPVEALREVKADLRESEESHTENLCRIIQRAALIHSKMENDERQIKDFYDLRFWNGRKYTPNKQKLLLHCMQYLVGAIDSDSPSYSTAHSYKTAVEILLSKGVSCTQMYGELVRIGGPYALLNKNNDISIGRSHSSDGRSSSDVDNKGANDQITERQASETFSANQSDLAGTSNKQSDIDDTKGGGRRLSIVRLFEKEKHIALTAGDYMGCFFSMAQGERTWLLVERVEDEGRFSRYKVLGVDLHDD